MISKEGLDSLESLIPGQIAEQGYFAVGDSTARELIRLARLGLWAEKYGMPALQLVEIACQSEDAFELMKEVTVKALDALPKRSE